ncbi:unnamed protein product [marine sediment metagenome]|uniref:Tyr recombinase domain-containing protein n=1 Tax=marine sediment metagenome TaxID=412755 RepID=X1NJK8_9ZZZZ
MRASELVSLNVSDIDIEGGYVRCFGKGHKERLIPIHERAASAVEEYVKEFRPRLTRNDTERALFLNRRGERLTRQGLWQILKGYAKSAELEIARAANAGSDRKEVLKLANDMITKVNLIMLADNLYYLAKGGRIHKKARPWADSKISNTAILKLDASTGGEHRPLARCKTKGQTLETLFDLVKQRSGGKKLHVAIDHADALAEAEQLKEKALSQFQCEEVFISNIGPLVTIHTGLGTRVFCWWSED